MRDDEKRAAKILGVKRGKELPEVSEETLKIYHSYLNKKLSFPFDAEYFQETGHLQDASYDIKVTGLLELDECDDLEFYGLFCKGKRGKREIYIPLAEVEVKKKGKNKQFVEDYDTWFWDYR